MKKAIFIILILSLLLLAGCGEKEGDTQPLAGRSFIGGNDGLALEFVPGAPPAEVFDNGKFPFSINIKLENVGEWDVLNPEDLTVTITGIDPSDFNNPTLSQNSPQPLIAKKKDTQGNEIPGTVTNLAFTGFSYLGNLAGDAQFTIKANACYSYGTKAVTKICIREDLLSLDLGVCQVNSDLSVENSAAPVKIASVKQAALGSDKLQLTFTIQKNGVGSLSQLGTECSTDITSRDRVKVTVNTGLTGTECTGFTDALGNPQSGTWGYVNLFGGQRIISCTQALTGIIGEFEKVIDFTLEYDFKESLIQSITVKHIS